MIIYELQCAAGHRFEGWFPGISACDSQVAQQMVHCAVCGTEKVRRVPAGGFFSPDYRSKYFREPRIDRAPLQVTPPTTPQFAETLSNVDPVILVKAMHQFVRSHARDVGDQFAELTIKMHAGEIPVEPIYGSATDAQRELLEDAGVSYASVPGIPSELDQ